MKKHDVTMEEVKSWFLVRESYDLKDTTVIQILGAKKMDFEIIEHNLENQYVHYFALHILNGILLMPFHHDYHGYYTRKAFFKMMEKTEALALDNYIVDRKKELNNLKYIAKTQRLKKLF